MIQIKMLVMLPNGESLYLPLAYFDEYLRPQIKTFADKRSARSWVETQFSKKIRLEDSESVDASNQKDQNVNLAETE